MKIEREFVLRDIAGDRLLVPVGKDAIDMNGLILLNELGVFLWEHIPAAQNEDELLAEILREYDVSENEARTDMEAFLKKLRDLKILAENG